MEKEMKKINFLGDSITQGACATKKENTYCALVAEHFKAQECNFGIGGTRIAKQVKKTCNPDDDVFMNRAVTMDKDADFTFVFGGTNDYGHGDARLGTFGDKDDYTFYGAFWNLVDYIKENFGDKACFILPLPRYNEENPFGDGSKDVKGEPLSKYIQAEKEVLDFYGVEYLDLSYLFPTPKTNTGDTLTADGLHPNDYGHKLLAQRLIEYLECRLYKNKK